MYNESMNININLNVNIDSVTVKKCNDCPFNQHFYSRCDEISEYRCGLLGFLSSEIGLLDSCPLKKTIYTS